MSSSPEASTSALPASPPPAAPAPLDKLLKPKKPSASSSKPKGPTPGIVYISRIPPGMTPHKVKHLMARWGATGKVFAQKDDAGAKAGKAHSVNYTEAWIEFLDKRVAKGAAAMLNAQPIGGNKGEKWRDDIWTMKYLPGFKWTMLGEQMAYERNSHTSRLRQELSKSKAEQAEYLQNVELARVLDKRRERAAAAGKEAPASLSGGGKRGREDKEKEEKAGGGGGGGEQDKRKKRKLKAVGAKRAEGERKLEDVLGSVF